MPLPDDIHARIAALRFTRFGVADFFPHYLDDSLGDDVRLLKRALFWSLQLPVRAYIWGVLHPRLSRPRNLEQGEVDNVYTKMAGQYDRTHHLTTRGMDLYWRRSAAWQVLACKALEVLDLCTGTGLTVCEILRAAAMVDHKAHVTGLDYNERMLTMARARALPEALCTFVRGDATSLTSERSGFVKLEPASFDLVTQVFGIGGVPDPLSVFRSVLQVLRPGGEYLVIDMHQPVRSMPGEVPLIRWIQTPNLEWYTYWRTTVPLALARLWGWRDPTMDFYLGPLVVWRDGGDYWGYKVVVREPQSERWWMGLPVMPTCRLLLRKIVLGEGEYQRRLDLLHSLGCCQ